MSKEKDRESVGGPSVKQKDAPDGRQNNTGQPPSRVHAQSHPEGDDERRERSDVPYPARGSNPQNPREGGKNK
jgi:hypothetical protein